MVVCIPSWCRGRGSEILLPFRLPRRATLEPPTLTPLAADPAQPFAATAAGAGGGGGAQPPKAEGMQGAPLCLLYARRGGSSVGVLVGRRRDHGGDPWRLGWLDGGRSP
jgi:hypothetical protein